MKRQSIARLLAFLAGSLGCLAAQAQDRVKTVFVIALENTNWTQVQHKFKGGRQQILDNPAAPFLNSLVKGTARLPINGVMTPISAQVAYASAYHQVLATAEGATGERSIHPSEPNYIWAEAGSNLGIYNDGEPYGTFGGNARNTDQHLSALLTKAGRTWKSYQEDIHLAEVDGKKTHTLLPRSQWTVPLSSSAGVSPAYVNAYNGSHQYDYAAKHNPMLFFRDTSGNGDRTPANPMVAHYAPLSDLESDLKSGAVADYNWITPNQFNDMHTPLAGEFTHAGRTYGTSGDDLGAKKIAQGDHFVSRIVPLIMASKAYRDGGAIIIWMDETVSDGAGNPNDFNHTLPEIVISPLARPNVNGSPYASPVPLSHSDDLRTMQDIFGVWQGGYLGDAAKAVGLSSLFAPGAVAPRK